MIIVKSRYKVTRVVYAETGYAALEAVNIEERGNPEVLLNVYEGEARKRFIRWFDSYSRCADFIECFISGESFVVAFRLNSGEAIDEVFYLDSKHTPEERILYADRLLTELIKIADIPYDISCPAMLSDNILLNLKDHAVSFRWQLRPLAETNERELICLTTDQLEKILIKRISAADSERDFMDELNSGKIVNMSALYSLWLDKKPVIEEEYKLINGKNFFSRWIYLLWHALKRKFRKNRSE